MVHGGKTRSIRKVQKFFDGEIDSVQKYDLKNASSANSAVASKKYGVHRMDVKLKDGSTEELALKSKSQKTLVNGILLLTKKNPKLRLDLILNHKIFSYNDSHRREISVYKNIDDSLRKHLINYRGYYKNGLVKKYNIMFDYHNIKNEKLNVKTAKRILDTILEFHIRYYNDIESAKKMNLNIYTPNDYRRAKKCIFKLYDSRHEENVKLYGEKKDQEIVEYINDIDKIMKKTAWHRTFTHNDFSTRNIFYNKDKVLFYDFELACFQNPEHDLMEMFFYDLECFTDIEVKELINYYKDGLRHGGIEISDDDFAEMIKYNTFEFVVNRLSMTKTINDHVHLDFADVSIPNSVRLLKLVEKLYE